MKKKYFGAILVAVLSVACLTGCNYDLIDTQYTFNYAIISLPDGTVVSGEVESWTDYEDGDQLQIKIDGVVYLTDTTRAVLMDK